jgi:hypothetical protein
VSSGIGSYQTYLVGERRINVWDGVRKDRFERGDLPVHQYTKSVVVFSLCTAEFFTAFLSRLDGPTLEIAGRSQELIGLLFRQILR